MRHHIGLTLAIVGILVIIWLTAEFVAFARYNVRDEGDPFGDIPEDRTDRGFGDINNWRPVELKPITPFFGDCCTCGTVTHKDSQGRLYCALIEEPACPIHHPAK